MALIDRLPPLPTFPNAMPELQPKLKAPQGGGFADTFKSFINDVNDLQLAEADKTNKFATGQIKDVHEVMAASEEANISLMLLIEVRNKLLDGYKELSRIPV